MFFTSYLRLIVGLTFSLVLLQSTEASLSQRHSHSHLHRRRHHHEHQQQQQHQLALILERPTEQEGANASTQHSSETLFKKRGPSQCAFPYGSLMVAVTPNTMNAGWAMSPDQPCLPGGYCPYACEPGYLMAQWDPSATSYTYPMSMNGGLHCNADGTISKPFPNKPYCVPGVGSVYAKNTQNQEVAFCQTVLPGNEAMLIATPVEPGSIAKLAVPDMSYWASTAAHYYINPAGVSLADACIWGTPANPVGNWSPFVAGANTDAKGNTFVKIGWNPIYTEDNSWNKVMPTWGVKIECDGPGCNGLPCACDPSIHGMNGCSSGSVAGAGGAAFCVVTVPPGNRANIITYATGPGANVGTGGSAPFQPNARILAIAQNAATTASVESSATFAETSTFIQITSASSVDSVSSRASLSSVETIASSSGPSSVSSQYSATSLATNVLSTSTATMSVATIASVTGTIAETYTSQSTLLSPSSASISLPLGTSMPQNATRTTLQSTTYTMTANDTLFNNTRASTMVPRVSASPSSVALLGGGAGMDNLVASAKSNRLASASVQVHINVFLSLVFGLPLLLILG